MCLFYILYPSQNVTPKCFKVYVVNSFRISIGLMIGIPYNNGMPLHFSTHS